MLVRAKTCFFGPAVMSRGETAEITDEVVLQNLLRDGLVEPVEAEAAPAAVEEAPKKHESKRRNKKRSV